MPMDSNRLLLKLEQARRQINRDTINPEINELTLDELQPIVKMVAKTRAAYVKELFDLAAICKGTPDKTRIDKLRTLREAFEETVAAANAMEMMIKRGYLDVHE